MNACPECKAETLQYLHHATCPYCGYDAKNPPPDLPALVQEVKRLREERDDARAIVRQQDELARYSVGEANQLMAVLRADNARLREALEFYASVSTYSSWSNRTTLVAIATDNGMRARAALANCSEKLKGSTT